MSSRVVAPEEEFVDLLCADQSWLRAEFEAIVAAGWPSPPERPNRPGGVRWPVGRSTPSTARPSVLVGATSAPATVDDDPRERAPPEVAAHQPAATT